LSRKCSAQGRLLLLGGGGYTPDSVARVWLASLAGITGITLPKDSPSEWMDFCLQKYGIEVSPNLTDQPLDWKKLNGYPFIEEEIIEATQQSINYLKSLLRPVPDWKSCEPFLQA
ncbi:MAG: hypothetical protein JSU57_01570, partial [Candidatus Heimdallarchaeota archaeon]